MSGLSADRRGAPPESSPPAPGGIPPDRAAATGTGHAGAFARLRPALFRAAACLVVAAAALLALPGGASAQENPVRPSWSLTPSGLSDGDEFRLIFLTSTGRSGNATSSNIEVYNTFVQDLVAAGHSAIRSYSSQFRVVGSTAAVDARDNTGTTGTGVPIYWLDGGKVADNYADFYDGSWSNEANAKTESGNNISIGFLPIFTGSNDDGTEYFISSGDSAALGNSTVRTGRLNHATANPLSGGSAGAANPGRFYALSPVFTVKAGPSITDVSVTSRPADGTDTFKHGERVEITFTFDEAVEVRNAGTAGADVYINVSVGNAGVFNQQTNFSRQDHPRKLVFAFTVTVSHVDGNGFCIGGGCGADNIKLRNSGAVVATADDVAAKRNYGRVQTSWKLAGGSDGLTGGVCDRHPAVRDAIVAAVSAADTCADVTDAHLVDNVGSLDLSGEGIGALRKEDFEGLTSLHTLDLSHNALDHLPADLFEPLDPSMRTLKLNGNPLGALPAGLFDGLTGIQELDLADTGLTELPAGLFADLDSLQELRLVENRLRAFPAAALADVAGTLRDLFMRDNDIPSIAAGALDGMTRLRKLELQDNALASLPAGLFDDATELRELKLNDNALASLPDDLLRPLRKLEVVRLQGNPGFDGFAPAVEAIPAQSVERGVRVDLAAETGTSPWGDNVTWTWTQTDSSGTTVTLNDANTATPSFDAPTVSDETTFTFEAKAKGRGTSGANASEGAGTAQVTVPGLPSIVDVSVTSSPADGSNTFKRRDRIEITATFSEPVQISASPKRLVTIDITLGTRYLFVDYNRQDHPNRLVFRRVVTSTDNGGLWLGNTDFENGPVRGTIGLSGSASITAVSDGTNARRLFATRETTWRVNGNTEAPTGGVCGRQHKVRDAIVAAVSAASTCADVTAAHLAGIASLDLSGEAIDSLHKRDFEGLAGLTELDLSGNALDYLPGDLFDHVTTLTELKLNGNDIAALPANVFNRLTALTELELHGNDIAALPANVFNRLTALRRLDLRGNALTGLPAGVFAALTDLRGLRLSNNALASLPDNVFAPLTKLENGALWITNNPGFADFVPRITVAVPAQAVRPGVRVDLEAVVEPNPWGSNLVWTWTRTDTGGETVTLEDDDTRVAHFVAPAPAVETGFAFEVTATGRGTAGVSSPSKATEDAAVTVEDTIGPELASASVFSSGEELYLNFNEDLDIAVDRFPPASAFTVKADGVEVAVSDVLPSAGGLHVLRLQLPAAAIGARQFVTVSYAVPATGTVIEDTAGNQTLPFTDRPVTNNSTVANTTPPVLTSASVFSSGEELYLNFNEDLDIAVDRFPPASAFTVKADGVEVAVSDVLPSAGGLHVLRLQLPTAAITDNQTVTVSYAVPESGPVIADTDGKPAKAFDDFAVTNNSTVDGTPPELASASVFSSGEELYLNFNEDLDIAVDRFPPASAFTVKADGVEVAVSDVLPSADGLHVLRLQLPAAAIGQSQTVTVSYDPSLVPATGTVIADVAGNKAAEFTDRRVTNNSTVFVKNATGTPTISGVPQVGNTLTADTSAIADENDLPATLTYQWFRVATGGLETPVGANSSSYTVSSADVGSTIRVDVSFTDLAGNPEGPLASDAVPAVPAAGTCPAGSDWRATLTMGYVLSETGSSRFHEFGFDPGSSFGDLHRATFPYGSTEVTVTLIYRALSTTLDGNTIRSDALTFTVTGGDLPDGTVLNLGATALTVGTDSQTTIAGQEQWNFRTLGLSPTWVEDQELTVCANLAPVLESAKADGTSLVLTYAEALDTGSEPAPGAYSVTVAGGVGPAVSNVSVSGRTVTLTLATAVAAGPAVTLTYSPGSNPVQDESGLDAPGFSNRTVAVNNDATGEPTIEGTPQVGEMLTADVSAIGDTDGLPSGFDYRWVRVAPGGAETDIGTNMSRYSPTYSDVGSTIRVEVSFTDLAGYPEGPLASTATAAVPPTTTSGTCPADSDWRAALTLGYSSDTFSGQHIQLFGFNPGSNRGALDPATITYGSTDYTVTQILRNLTTSANATLDSLSFAVSGGELPDGTVLNLGGTTFTVGTDSRVGAGQEQWNLRTLGISLDWVADQELTVCANLPPGLESATVEGTSLVLTYTEDLDTRSVPLPGAYSVTVAGGADPAVSSVSVSGTTVTLTLADPVTAADTVTVTYTPGSNPVQDGSGLDALPLTGEEVAIRDETPPIPASGGVSASGAALRLTFNEDLDIAADRLPPAEAFTVKADGVEVTVQSVALGFDVDQLAFSLPTGAIKQGQTVTVSYAVPDDDENPLQDVARNKAAEFTDFEVDNNSTLEGTPPVPASAEVQIPGETLNLTFNEDLDFAAGFPPASAFIVKADGVEVTVQSVVGTSLDTLALSLSATIKQGQTVTVSYAVPESGTVIEDTVGNDALAFTDFEVTNNSTVDGTPPIPESGTVTTSGDVLRLTFNEDLDIGPLSVPPASAFTVKADGVEVTVQSVVGTSLDTLVLSLSSPIGARQIVTVSYAVPTTGTVIEDLAGNDALAFTDFPVTNNSTVANTTPPVPASAEVPASGASLTLTFNEDLDNGSDKLPPASAFTVTASGDDVPVQSVTAGSGADSFVLDLGADAIKEKQCHTVTVDYEVPTTNPIQDTDGNPAVAFTYEDVVNNSTVECPNDHSPVFPAPDPRMLTVEENVPLGTAIGDPVTATDADGDTLTYSLDDTASVFSHYFQIDSATGQLQTNVATGLIFNHEKLPTNVYGIIVVADDGREGTDTARITVVVSVTDVLEPPDAPLEVTVTGSGTTSLQVTWTAPPNLGRPAIEDYDVQYREAGETQWMDGPQDVIGTSATIMPVDAGKSYEVQVRATNDEGDGPWAVWGADEAVPVTIEAQYDSIGAGLEDLLFTLTREGDTTGRLTVKVTITQEHSWLSDSDLEHEVTFEDGEAAKELPIAASKFSFTPSTPDDLTARVSVDGISGGEDIVLIVSTAGPPITVSLEEAEYTVAEVDPAEDAAIYVVAKLHPDYPRPPAAARDFGIAVSTESGTATFREDFVPITTVVDFRAGDYALVDGQYVVRKSIGFEVVDDQVYEGSEGLVVKVEASANLNRELVQILMPDGTAGDRYPVTITDEEDVPVLSLSVVPSSIAEEDDDGTTGVAENVSTVTVGITNGKTFAVDRTVTLTFSGDATEGTHYSVSPTDADTNAAGHQVVLPAGDASVEVTVTAAANDTADGNRTVTVVGDLDGTVIGSSDITIRDDETTTTNTDAEGKPSITGTPQVGQTLTADVSDIMDTNGLPSSYDYDWVSVDASDVETIVGNNNTYSPDSSDVDKTIKVEVSFTDLDGFSEGPLTSDAVGPVVAAEPQACVLGGDVWCATLTVQDLAGPSGHGCANSQSGKACSNPSHLTEDEFRHDGTDYDVTSISVATNGDLKLWLDPDPTAPTRTLVLVVDGERFALAHSGGSTSGSRTGRQWSGTGLSWSTGATVELRLVEGFPPLAPGAPGVNGVENSDMSLKVTWGAPNNAGPPITHYDLRYRTGTSSWQNQTGTNATNATIAGLTTGAEYDVQVRASNADGDGPWSPSGQGTPGVVEETIPNGKLQLVDKNGVDVTNTTGIGRLEVYLKKNGKAEWGTVCEDRFDRPFADRHADPPNPNADEDGKVPNVAAQFACQQMGRATGEMVPLPTGMTPLPDDGTTPIWLDDVRCAGTVGDDPPRLEMANHWRKKPATMLQHCYHAGVGLHNCDHTEDVYLQCTGTLNPESATQEEAAPLTASFEDLPETHDGATAFTFRLVLSADIANSDADVRDSAFEVTGGSVTDVGRVGGRSDLWEITVTPDGTGNIGIVLLADRACGTAGALCTADGRALTTALLVTVPASPQQAGALTAVFADMPADHGGAAGFTFTLRFSESFPIGYVTMRDHAFTVTNGRVTRARRLDNPHHENQGMQPNREWEITVAPDTGAGDVTITLPETTDCAATGAVCTEDGTMLSGAVSATVPHTYVDPNAAAAAPLRASFANVPAEHDGGTVFTFEVRFSEAFRLSYVTMRDDVLTVTNARVTRAQRLDNPHHEHEGMQPNRTWKISVSPDAASEDVTIVLPATTSCDASGAVCTGDGRKLSNTESATVAGPPSLSIADAQVDEAAGATLEFTVSLSRAASATVTVDWATADGTATAGSDYTADSGTLNFAPDETSKTVAVAVLDDSHDEGNETLTVTLSNPSGAYLADSEATGTIENTDHMPQAWLSRFGRTVAEQVLDAVEERIRSAPQAGVQVTVAGQRIGAAQAPDADALEEAEAQARLEGFSTWLRGEACRDDPGAGGDCPARTRSREVTPRDLLTGTSFALTTGADGIGGGLVSLWGRGAVSSFDGREDELSLSGEVTGAMLGADWTRERSTLGLMLSHARGEGSYRGADSGKVSSTVTGLYPYGRYAVTDRVTVWGSAGYGVGTLTLTPDGKSTYEADMDLAMAAAGLRGVVVEAPDEGGPELAVKTDAMAVRTSSEATEDSAGGKLAAATADVTRLRLGLEGTWRGLEIGTGTLVPRLELGVRHDGGDAETGFGLDLGGGLAWSDPGTGLRAEVSGRGLLTHESAGFRERGIAGSFGWDPTPGSDRGPSLTLSQTMGLSAQGGADALLGRTTLAGLAANDNGDELERRRLEVKLGYGFGAFGDRFTATPEVGFGMSAGHRDYSLAWRFVRDRRRGDIGSLEFSLEATRRESANDDAEPEHGVGLRMTARW